MFESFLCLITDNLHAESTCHFDTGVISHKMLLQTVWRNTRGDKGARTYRPGLIGPDL